MLYNHNKYYILYDGDCGFCNFWVEKILKNDKNDQFLFAALESDFAQSFLKEEGLEQKAFDTIYLYSPEEFYFIKSKAIFKIAEILGGRFYLLSFFKIFPQFLCDFVYDCFSKNRKNIASAKCYFPTPDERKKIVL